MEPIQQIQQTVEAVSNWSLLSQVLGSLAALITAATPIALFLLKRRKRSCEHSKEETNGDGSK